MAEIKILRGLYGRMQARWDARGGSWGNHLLAMEEDADGREFSRNRVECLHGTKLVWEVCLITRQTANARRSNHPTIHSLASDYSRTTMYCLSILSRLDPFVPFAVMRVMCSLLVGAMLPHEDCHCLRLPYMCESCDSKNGTGATLLPSH